MGRGTQLALVSLVAVAALVGGAVLSGREQREPPAGRADVRCDRVLDDGDAAAFVAGLGPGETGCLRDGVHEVDGVATIEAPGVVLTSYPGESATLAGRLWVESGADRALVEDLTLDGRNEAAKPSPTVNADGAVFRGNDISNDHTAICFVIGDDRYGAADGTVIEGNRIHDCGRLPATNHEHGIYVAYATDTTIEGNLIYDNADRGVQLYPDADRTLVSGNVIDGNGQGVIFAGDSDRASDDNVVTGNVITNSTIRYNIESHWQGPVGAGNVARDNCVWTARSDYPGSPPGSGIEPSIDGVAASGNVVVDPDYADPDAGDFSVGEAVPCAPAGDAGA